MNSKTKILTILLLTVLVFAGGGYYFYKQTNPTSPKGVFWYQNFSDNSGQNMEIVSDNFDNLPKKSKSGRINHVFSSEPSLSNLKGESMVSDLYLSNKSIGLQQKSGSTYMDRSYSYNREDKDSRIHSTLSGGLTYNTAKGGKRISTGTSGSSINGPMAVPFSPSQPGTPSTSGGTILFDPGAATTQEIEQNAIPVGEGWWVMLIMLGAYVMFRKRIHGI